MGGLLFIPALCGEVFWSAGILAALGDRNFWAELAENLGKQAQKSLNCLDLAFLIHYNGLVFTSKNLDGNLYANFSVNLPRKKEPFQCPLTEPFSFLNHKYAAIQPAGQAYI